LNTKDTKNAKDAKDAKTAALVDGCSSYMLGR